MGFNDFAIFVIAVFFAWIRVMVGPTLQIRNFFIGFFLCLLLTLLNFFIYCLIIKWMDSILGGHTKR